MKQTSGVLRNLSRTSIRLSSIRLASSASTLNTVSSIQLNPVSPLGYHDILSRTIFLDKNADKEPKDIPEESQEVPEAPETPAKDTPEAPEESPEKTPETPETPKTPDQEPEKVPEDKIDNETVKSVSDGVAAGAAGGATPPSAPPSGGNPNKDEDFFNQRDAVSKPLKANNGLYPPLLAIPMTDRMPLPGSHFLINVTDPEVIKACYETLNFRESYFGLFHVKDSGAEDTDIIKSRDDVHDVGVYCQLFRFNKIENGLYIFGYAHGRCKIEDLITGKQLKPDGEKVSYLKNYDVSTVIPRIIKDDPYNKDDPKIRDAIDRLISLMAEATKSNPKLKESIAKCSQLLYDPSKFADALASTVAMEPSVLQELLANLSVLERLDKLYELLEIEVALLKMKNEVSHSTTKKMKNQMLKNLVKDHIQELLKVAGLVDEKKKSHKFEKRLAKLKMPKEARDAYKTEFEKLTSGNDHPTELVVVEKYLDWLTLIPWGIFSKDKFNLKEARDILERDHHGLKDVKERILEFISIGKVSGKVDGKILCLAGPPGTGKTSIAKSIAEALGRRYVRISMGGIRDVHEVKGHRRTYVGSIPGRIIFSLKQAKTSNPLMLIDEIDKLDMSLSGGAALAFLEILDPEQNHGFLDNYMDVKVDLSKVLFVCTANYLGNIPPPLRDRMEIIHVPGYTNNEKIEIIEKHLIPNASSKVGLSAGHINIARNAISRLVEKYCRESGLRNLKTLVTRIFSKASLKIVEEMETRQIEADKNAPPATAGADLVAAKEAEIIEAKDEEIVILKEKLLEIKTEEEEAEEDEYDDKVLGVELIKGDFKPVQLDVPEDIKVDITAENLKDFVGPEVYTRDRLYDTLPPGVATGLAYSSSGNGDALYIESILTNSISSGTGNSRVNVTGSLRDVMKESASISYSFVKLYMVKNFPDNRFFEAAEIHVHCPDGSIPKDGPSAGVSFTSSLLSLALNQLIPPNIAMTGEITVTGRVLPVGGLREKILGAKRYGCDTIIFPKDIEHELAEIPEEVKEGITFVPVQWYQDVFNTIFPDMTKDIGNLVWKEEFAKLDHKEKSRKKRQDPKEKDPKEAVKVIKN